MIDDAEGYVSKWRRLASDSEGRDPEAVAEAALRDFTALCRSLPGGDGCTLYRAEDATPVEAEDVPSPPALRHSEDGTRCRAVGSMGWRCRFPTSGTPFCAHHDSLSDVVDTTPAP